jgi:hypothetical protein
MDPFEDDLEALGQKEAFEDAQAEAEAEDAPPADLDRDLAVDLRAEANTSWKRATLMRDAAEAIERLAARNADLIDVLAELAALMDGVTAGDYEPDSFTTQAACIALAAAAYKAPETEEEGAP